MTEKFPISQDDTTRALVVGLIWHNELEKFFTGHQSELVTRINIAERSGKPLTESVYELLSCIEGERETEPE